MRQALFMIDSDPRRGGRALEGLRIAAGVRGWQQVQVRVFLDDVLARALAEMDGGLAEEPLLRQCLRILGTESEPLLVPPRHAVALNEADWDAVFAATDTPRLARLAWASDCVLHF